MSARLAPLLLLCGCHIGSLSLGSLLGLPDKEALVDVIETDSFPNGIAADDDFIYVVIGEPHSSPDSRPIAAGQRSVVQVYSADTLELVDEIDVAAGGHAMEMTPDGEKLYIAHFSLDNAVTAIDLDNYRTVEVGGALQLDILAPDSVSISPDGRYTYVGSNGPGTGFITRIDTETDEIDDDFRAEVEGGFTCWVEASPKEDILYANSWTGGTVQRKSLPSGRSEESVSVGAFPHAVSPSKDGEIVYAMVSGGNQVLALDPLTLETVDEIDGPWASQWGGPVSGTLSRAGRHLFVANHTIGQVAVVNIDPDSPDMHTVVATLPAGQDPIFMALSPDGDRLYVADNASATISVLDVTDWQ